MATTKKAAVVSGAKNVGARVERPAPAPAPAETDIQIADAYLADRIYDALLERGEASKVSEITLEIDNARLTFPLVRRCLIDSKRFVPIERSWDLASRYVDTSRPASRILQDVLRAAGRPLSLAHLATELSIIHNRPSDIYLAQVARMLDSAEFVRLPGGEVALAEWLPLTDGESTAELLSDNQVRPELLRPLQAAAAGVDWADYVAATVAVLDRLKGKPLRHRTLGVLAAIALGARYDSRAHLAACWGDPRLVWLDGARGGRWITRATADRLELQLEERAASLGEEEEEPAAPEPEPVAAPVEAEPVAEEVAAPAEPVAAPLGISDEDLAAMAAVVAGRETPMEISELLALQYEVVPGDASYRADLETLSERVRGDERFLYVGAGRVREPNSLPLFVHSIPDLLAFPDLQFISMDGEIMDEEIEDEGFAGSLRQDVLSPLAQDAGDDEGAYTGPALTDPDSVTLVVKAHHKEIGTFPLCQVPDDFFPSDAPIVEIVLREADGPTHEIVVNRDPAVRLAFGFFGVYEKIGPDSGGVFRLTRTVRPYEYRFEPVAEPDAEVYVDAARTAELQSLREHVEDSGDMATFDIVCEVLEAYPKGISFVRTLTEVNLVRRVNRRKLASILSNYYCFAQKAGLNLWRFDPKKREMGTDRTKRKYIKR